MIFHTDIEQTRLLRLIKSNYLNLAANKKLKIYGKISCASGKRMNKTNRIFFKDSEEAISQGYRPCGHCIKNEYLIWKNSI